MRANMETNPTIDCPAHSGIVADIKNMKKEIAALWQKWGFMEKLMITVLIGVIGNLFGLLVLIYLRANGG